MILISHVIGNQQGGTYVHKLLDLTLLQARLELALLSGVESGK